MVTLSPALLKAVKDQRAILFLGAGASIGASHPKGDKVPLGDALRDKISDTFLGGALKTQPLASVAAMAANETGLIELQKFVREVFEPFQPAKHHRLLPKFRWRSIATTNYDLVVERAYNSDPKRLQNLVVSIKDGDLFDVRERETTSPLGYYKLHGCVDHYLDQSIPLILGQEQYASYLTNRRRFYDRLKDEAYDNPIIFCGYRLADLHIQQILFDLTDEKISRPMYYMVSPHFDEIEERYWQKNRVQCIKATLDEFLVELDSKIPSLSRRIPGDIGGGKLSIRTHYRIHDAVESAELREYFDKDITHIHSGLTAPYQDPVKYYKGHDDGWGGILQNLDIRRSVCDSVLVDVVLDPETESRKRPELFMIKGPAGNGKSIILKRIAWEAGTHYEKLVLYTSSVASLNADAICEIYKLTGKMIFLFVDRVALVRDQLVTLLDKCRDRSVAITVIGAERDNEWNIYCEDLEKYVRQEFPVRYMTEKAVVGLLELLERHKALGILEDKPQVERVRAFVERAGSQILVALHEATLGVPFEKIVLNEYTGIEPPAARRIYLLICALHQYGVRIRAGLISRVAGINFDEFGSRFIKPLENVVMVNQEEHNGDVYYESRHQHVAELVFNQALPNDEEKYEILTQLAQAINIDYSTDKETFGRMIRGRGISNTFAEAGLGRLFYDKLQELFPGEAFVYHQRAVYELQHKGGELVHAETAAAQAYTLAPHSRSIRNTQADIARRRAGEENDPLRKQAFRKAARSKLGGTSGNKQSSYDQNTRARLALDELRDLIESSAESNSEVVFLEALREAEQTIQRGVQLFPDSAELAANEATLQELLDKTSKAMQTLEKAFDRNPRQDWLAARLARGYQKQGDIERAIGVLNRCLKENPASKSAHLAIAHLMRRNDGNSALTLEHYKRSFTAGDNNYEGQFWYARELFVRGRTGDAEDVFRSVNERAPGRFRNAADALITVAGERKRFQGKVERKEEGYAFVRFPEFSKAIFASRADSDAVEWDSIAANSTVSASVGFNRRGARVLKISPSGFNKIQR